MDVSVIIVNYNTLSMTKECIDSVYERTSGLEFEVILVDNGSQDGSKEYFEKDCRICYVYSDENLGFGRANSLGYEQSTGEYVFLLNSDTLLLNNAILEFYEYIKSAPSQVCCLGCELIDNNGRPSYSFGTFPSNKIFLGMIMKEYHFKFKVLSFPCFSKGNHPLTVDYSSGADMFIRRKVIEELGFFDPDFFMYFEEVELQYRYHTKGYISQVIDTPKIMHLLGGSELKKNKNAHSLKTKIIELESRYIYCTKVFKPIERCFMPILHLLLIPRILLYKSSWEQRKEMLSVVIKNLI